MLNTTRNSGDRHRRGAQDAQPHGRVEESAVEMEPAAVGDLEAASKALGSRISLSHKFLSVRSQAEDAAPFAPRRAPGTWYGGARSEPGPGC